MMDKDPLQDVLRYIDENLDEYLSVGKLAEIANYSAPQLFRLFMSGMAVTPMQYALRRRLYYAAKTLACGDAKVIDVANDFGFASHDSFCRAFKRFYGVTPSAFRKNAWQLNAFYRDNLYCIVGYSAPPSLLNHEECVGDMAEQYEKYEEFCRVYGNEVEIVTVPQAKLIGVARPVGEGAHKAFYEAYDKIFRNAPNRKYPQSENATHGLPRASADGKTRYFFGVEVTSFDGVPDGAICVALPEQLCAVIGFEGGIDYDTIDYYFAKWIRQSQYRLDPQKIDPGFSENAAWKTYSPIWEYYAPNKDCPIYEERIYLPVTPK